MYGSIMILLRALGDELEQRRARQLECMWRIQAPARALAPLAGFLVGALLLWWLWPQLFTGQPSADVTYMIAMCMLIPLMVIYAGPNAEGSPFGSGLIADDTRTFAGSARAFALALLDATRRQDPTVAHVLEEPGTSGEDRARDAAHSDDVEELEPLAHPLAGATPGRATSAFMTLSGALLLAALAILVCAVFWSVGQLDLLGPPIFALMALVAVVGLPIAALLLISGIISGHYGQLERRGMVASVDGESVTFRLAGVDRQILTRIAWSDVQAIGRISYRDSHFVQRAVYLLLTERDVALWAESMPPRYSSEPVVERARARSETARRLLGLARARTGLPLLDLSTTIDALAAKYDSSAMSWAWNLPAQALDAARTERDETLARAFWRLLHPNGEGGSRLEAWLRKRFANDRAISTLARARRLHLLEIARALLPYYETSAEEGLSRARPSANWRHTFMRVRVWLKMAQIRVALTVIWSGVALSLAGWIAGPLYSTPTERDLAAQAPRATPLYAVALDSPTSGWPTGALNGSQSARFTTQGYEVAAGSGALTAVTTAPNVTMGDGAVMVTLSLSGPPDADPEGGLSLLTAGGTGGVVFETDGLGRWALYHYRPGCAPQWDCANYMDSGRVPASAYLTPSDMTPLDGNVTLLIIRRGRTYLLYLDGRFLDAYHDALENWTPGDRVGLVADGFGVTATFTDLAVYPVPDGMPFWAR